MVHEMEEQKMKARTSETESSIGHVITAGGNIFLDLGFPPDEAARLRADSDRRIAERIAMKKYLVNELAKWIEEKQLSPVDAANKFGVSPERVGHVLARNEMKFSVDQLVKMLIRAGKKIQIDIY